MLLTNIFRVWKWFKVWEYHLSTKAVPPQYYPFRRSKIVRHRQFKDNFKTI